MFRVTMFMSSGRYGWSETHFTNASSIQNAKAQLNALMAKRTLILANQANMDYGRVSDELVFRDSEVIVVNLGNQPGNSGDEDLPATSLDVRLEGSSRNRRTLSLRGIPDVVVVEGGQFRPIFLPQWFGRLSDYMLLLTNPLSPFGIRAVDKTAPSGSIAAAAGLNQNYIEVTTTAAHGQTGTWPVVIRGRGIPVALQGRHAAYTTAPDKFQIISPYKLTTYTGFGTWQKLVYEFKAYTDFAILRVLKRNTGRPSVLPRGRRRGVRLTL